MLMTNIVTGEELRKIQLNVLNTLSRSLICSFGPKGSNTLIIRDGMLPKYSKDGYTILGEIKARGVLEQSIIDNIVEVTRNIVTEFGDNSTSAVLLCDYIFEKLIKLEEETGDKPADIIRNFADTVDKISEIILSKGKKCELQDIYDIAYVSTDGDTVIAEELKKIYEKYGNDVFIDVARSNTSNDEVKAYDGMTLDTGFADPCFINNKPKAAAVIRNPEIYVFANSIDTPEMAGLFDSIVGRNFIAPLKNGEQEVPTVIITEQITQDLSVTISTIKDYMKQFAENAAARPRFVLIDEVFQKDELMDIAELCGCRPIIKYIDPKIQQEKIESGEAPTPTTIDMFAGTCEEVTCNAYNTKFVNPQHMHTVDENGNLVFSDTYKAKIEFFEANIKIGTESGQDKTKVGMYKRRLQSLKANLVEYLVGGITMADRDSRMDLIEDAVLNCRAAAKNGVGRAANFEGLMACKDLIDEATTDPYVLCIYDAYMSIVHSLYGTCMPSEKVVAAVNESIEKGTPIDLRTMEYNSRIKSSITSDTAVLSAISKIVTRMFTSNQVTLPNPLVNTYFSQERLEKEMG